MDKRTVDIFAPTVAVVTGAVVQAMAASATGEQVFLASVGCTALLALLAGKLLSLGSSYQAQLERTTPVLHIPGKPEDPVSATEIAQRYGLAKRETEVLELVLQGLTISQMADQQVLSKSTVKLHVTNILRKAEPENRQQMLEKLGIRQEANG